MRVFSPVRLHSLTISESGEMSQRAAGGPHHKKQTTKQPDNLTTRQAHNRTNDPTNQQLHPSPHYYHLHHLPTYLHTLSISLPPDLCLPAVPAAPVPVPAFLTRHPASLTAAPDAAPARARSEPAPARIARDRCPVVPAVFLPVDQPRSRSHSVSPPMVARQRSPATRPPTCGPSAPPAHP